MGFSHTLNQLRHRGIGLDQICKNGHQTVLKINDATRFHLKIQHPQEFPIRPRIGHQRGAAQILHFHRYGDTIVGVPAQNRINATQTAGHFQIHIHAIVGQHHHHLRPLGTRLVDGLLHILLLNTKSPVRHHVARVRNGGIRKSLPNDGHRHAVHRANLVGLKHRIFKIRGFDVLRKKRDLVLEVMVDDVLDSLSSKRHLPVCGHDVNPHEQTRIHHVLPLGPERGCRALPSIASIQEECSGARGSQSFDERGHGRKPTHLAIGASGLIEVQRREGVSVFAPRRDAIGFEKMFTHEMGRLTTGGTRPQIDTGLSIIGGNELRMRVGEMQQMHIAQGRQVIKLIGCMGGF